MVIAHETDATIVARAYLGELGADPHVQELFVEIDRGGVVLWLLVEPLDMEAEDATDRYYDAFVRVLQQRHDVPLEFHLVDPQDYDPRLPLVGGVIPDRAKPVQLRG